MLIYHRRCADDSCTFRHIYYTDGTCIPVHLGHNVLMCLSECRRLKSTTSPATVSTPAGVVSSSGGTARCASVPSSQSWQYLIHHCSRFSASPPPSPSPSSSSARTPVRSPGQWCTVACTRRASRRKLPRSVHARPSSTSVASSVLT